MNHAEYKAKLIADGYSEAHAERMASLAYPTPRQLAARKAREARKAKRSSK